VLAAGWSLRLLHLLVDVAMHGLLALAIAMGAMILLVALAVVAPSPPPPGSKSTSRVATDLCRVTMMLGSRGCVPCRRQWVLFIELHERTLGQVL
jgi:hypothetical protein